MLAMYQALRHLRSEGAVGVVKNPVRGLVPGCPATTDWLMLLARPWLSRVRQIEAGVKGRTWVDDLTAWQKADFEKLVAFVQLVLQLTGSMRAAFGLKLNLIKSIA